ncbi:hypothetical protein COOONC_08714 [Cooperia oncophora]
MDATTILTMFREIMDEQKNVIANVMNEQKNVIAKLLDRIPERGQGDCNTTEHIALPNLMAALSNRIEKFVFDPDADMIFSKWFSRYKDVFNEDAKQLSENTKVRLLCEKLDPVSSMKYQRHRLPRDWHGIAFKRDSSAQTDAPRTMKLSGKPRTVHEAGMENKCWTSMKATIGASGCQAKPWFCKKCRKVAHKERFCDTLRQKKTASRTEATQKTQHTKEKFSRNRNNRGPRRQVRIVKIANAAVQANSSRVYIDAVVNNYSVKFLLDTGSDITLLQRERFWKKIYGKLKCKITMKGVTTEGDAYVTPHSSLLGLEWIRANENLMHHIEMMAEEVKANCNPRREEEVKKTFLDVFEEGVGRCTKEEVNTLKRGFRNLKGEEKPSEDKFNVILQAHRTTPHRCLEDRTESSTGMDAEENRRKMKQEYARRNGSISKEFHKGYDCTQMWKAPHSTWKQGVVAKRLGKVNYEVPVEGRLMRKHANQLRHSNTRTSWNRVDKSLKTLLDMLEVDDNWLKSNDDTASDLDVNTALPCSPELSMRRSTRIRRLSENDMALMSRF